MKFLVHLFHPVHLFFHPVQRPQPQDIFQDSATLLPATLPNFRAYDGRAQALPASRHRALTERAVELFREHCELTSDARGEISYPAALHKGRR